MNTQISRLQAIGRDDTLTGQYAEQLRTAAGDLAGQLQKTVGRYQRVAGELSRCLASAVGAVWVLPSAAALVAVIVCRRPARRQVFMLVPTINIAAGAGVLVGGMGVAAGLYGAPPVAVVICGVAVVSGLATLVLQYVFRIRRVR